MLGTMNYNFSKFVQVTLLFIHPVCFPQYEQTKLFFIIGSSEQYKQNLSITEVNRTKKTHTTIFNNDSNSEEI